MESSASLELAKHVLLMFGTILAVGTFSGLIARLVRLPDVVVFLLVGMLLGPAVLGIVNIKADSSMNQLILIFGSSYILFDGGASIRLKVLKEVWITIVVISTVGVMITAAITGVAAYYFLGLAPIVALLLGTVIASTDPATLVPVFKQVRIKDRVAQTVMSESAFNDAMGAILTFTVLAVAMGAGEFSIGNAVTDLLKQSLLGILIGGTLGYLAAFLISHEKFGFLAEFAPVVTLMAVIGAYMGADGLHSSGFMAVFVFGIMIGNQESLGFKLTQHEDNLLEDYVMTTAFIMRMFIFILLRHAGGFRPDEPIPARRRSGGRGVHAGSAPHHRVPVRPARPARQVEPQGAAVHVLDARDRRDPRRIGRHAGGHESPRRADHRLGDFHRDPDDHPDPGDHDQVAGKKTGLAGGRVVVGRNSGAYSTGCVTYGAMPVGYCALRWP